MIFHDLLSPSAVLDERRCSPGLDVSFLGVKKIHPVLLASIVASPPPPFPLSPPNTCLLLGEKKTTFFPPQNKLIQQSTLKSYQVCKTRD